MLFRSLFLFALTYTAFGYAQKTDRDHLRYGNRMYRDSLYDKAEVSYRKAIELNPSSAEAIYNLGNALLMQTKTKEALEQYQIAAKMEQTKPRMAQTYHNAGVVLQGQQQFAEAIEMYKQALRNNPADNETRYNLALSQYQLKNNPDQDNQDNQDNQDKDRKSVV